jgi:hypothetical protein
MNKNYTPHDYKFAKALQESLAQDVENKKSLFKNPEDIELAKRIIRGQEWNTEIMLQSMPGINQSLHQWTNWSKDASIVVTGHSTKSIAVYATRLSQVRNDNNTKTHIPWHIHIDTDMGIQIMTTYIYCKECNKLYNKELGCSTCELKLYTEELDWAQNWLVGH